MLPRSKRLNLKKDFKRVASGKKVETSLFKLFIKEGADKETKVGIATSSKVFKKATDRNRARRLLSFAFESLISKLPTDVSIVALPKSGILEVKSSEVLLDLEEALKEERVIARNEMTKQSSK